MLLASNLYCKWLFITSFLMYISLIIFKFCVKKTLYQKLYIMLGCTGSSNYNGRNLDTNPNVKKVRLNVEIGCPCRAVLLCRNGGVCVDGTVPFCQCTHGWSGRTCEDIVYVAPVLGKCYIILQYTIMC